ncbi:MAG TPA: sigma 54-interacting transcriptional regulator [Kofleriaceae bacterium]|nr:sigma 54-interacting transcriptional regulator [Kofleriaceae bacterium]
MPRKLDVGPILVTWDGPAAPAMVTRALVAAGVTVLPRGGTGAIATIVTGRRNELPMAARGPGTPWLWVVPGEVSAELGMAAAKAGAYDAIGLGEPNAAARIVARVRELATPQPALETGGLVAQSAAMREVLAAVARAAETSLPVMFTGETGTGKDVAARLLHARSARASHRLVAINCAAVPNELMEAELFGYVRGAFSGATRDYDGQLAAAAGGTVFLDEIDDTPPTLQAKLLRVLEDHVVSRLGENLWRAVDFRIVAATNRDPAELIARGVLAPDLYNRLATITIHVPPLRERAADIPALAAFFVERFYADEPGPHRHHVHAVAPAAQAVLARHTWPGNVRELRNVVYQSLVGKRAGDELLASDLPRRLFSAPGTSTSIVDSSAISRALDDGTFDLRAARAALEREALTQALARSSGNAAAAARLLGEVGRGDSSEPAATVRAMARRLGLR